MSRNSVARLNRLEAARLPNPDSLFLLWVKPGTPVKEQKAQIYELGLSASLDGVICAEWTSKEEMPGPRWRLYRDIPRNEIDVLNDIIKKTVLEAGADELKEAAALPEASDLDRLSDRDLMARIFSVGREN